MVEEEPKVEKHYDDDGQYSPACCHYQSSTKATPVRDFFFPAFGMLSFLESQAEGLILLLVRKAVSSHKNRQVPIQQLNEI